MVFNQIVVTAHSAQSIINFLLQMNSKNSYEFKFDALLFDY